MADPPSPTVSPPLAPGAPPVPVIVNAAAGLGRRDRAAEIEAALASAGVESRLETTRAAEVGAAVRREMDRGERLIAVAGGDGTLLAAAEVMAGSEATLAPIPVGTLNHFARRLGVDTLAVAAAAVREQRVTRVPVGVVDERVFLNTATFGFYADVVRRRERYRPVLGKWGGAALGFALTLARLRTMDVTLLVEGERLERRTSLVWVGVGWGSFPLVHESPDRRGRPELEIVVLRPRGIASSAALILRLLLALRRRQRPIDDPALEILHARQLVIKGHHRIGVTLDGEVLRSQPPILIALQDEALRVLRGPAEPEGGRAELAATD